MKKTDTAETDSNGQGCILSGTGEEEDHTQPHEYREAGRSGHGEIKRMEEVVEGAGSLTARRPPIANAEIPALGASTDLIETPSSADRLAEAKAIYTAQREAARIAIPVLLENYKNQKELLETGKQSLQFVREVPLPRSGEGLTPQQLIDLIATRRQRITAAIDLLEESDSLTQVRVQAVQLLKNHLIRVEKWAEDNGFDIQARRDGPLEITGASGLWGN
ncbi:hypothetical protein FRC01_012393 [Tulasnella sp. 417]|nr:hypothetical protein FRC01_012393 [Tulasnella sp. 417]